MFDNIKENISNISSNTILPSLTSTKNIKEQKKSKKKNKKIRKNLMLNYKHRIRPTKSQLKLLNQYIFVGNQVFNITLSLLDKQRLQYKAYKNLVNISEEYLGEKISKKVKFKNYSDTILDQKIKQILNKRNLYCPIDILQGERKIAKKAFFDGFKEKGYASFRKSKMFDGSFNWTNARTKLDEKFVNFDQSLKDIRINRERYFPQETKLKQVRIKKKNNKFYVIFTIEFLKRPEFDTKEYLKNNKIKSKKKIKELEILSMDTNNGHLDFSDKSVEKYKRSLSEKELNALFKKKSKKINNNRSLDNKKQFKRKKSIKQKEIEKQLREYKKILKLEQKSSKREIISKNTKTKLGKNYKKDRLKLSKLNEKISNRRKNLLDKLSNDILSKTFDVLVVEDLNVKNMTKKTSEEEYKKTNKSKIMSREKDKSMRKNILNFSYSTLHNMLSYKAMHNERLFVKIDPKNTSKMCSSCKKLNKISLKTREYICEYCHFKINRDYNSSINIENLGLEYILNEFGLKKVCLRN